MAKTRPVRIQIKQLKELQAALKRGESALDPKAVSRLIADALNLIREGALKNLLMNFQMRTGNLAKSLITRITQSNSSTHFGAWTKAGGKQIAPHAHLLEYGHVMWRGGRRSQGRGHQIGGARGGVVKRSRVEGRPFFRPAVDENRREVRKRIRVGLQKLLAESGLPGEPGNATD